MVKAGMEQDQQEVVDKEPMEGGPTHNTKKKKRKIQPYYHIKAHTNPLSDKGFQFDVTKYFAPEFHSQRVEFADVGCGYGGLLVSLGAAFPNTLVLGIEIRDKVVEYVQDRIERLRKEHPGQYGNIAVEQTNAMKYLPNYFAKGQLKKMFFLFPDPHFKKSNHRRRIITPQLLAEYAYVLQSGGMIYTITDVEDLHKWMVQHLSEHPLFQRVSDQELEADSVVPLVTGSSEEARKVEKAGGNKYLAVYRRV